MSSDKRVLQGEYSLLSEKGHEKSYLQSPNGKDQKKEVRFFIRCWVEADQDKKSSCARNNTSRESVRSYVMK